MTRVWFQALAAVAALTISACAPGSRDPVQKLPTSSDQAPVSTGHLVVLMITDNTDHQQTGANSIAVGTSQNSVLMAGFFRKVEGGTGMTVDMHSIAGSAPPNDPFNCDNIVATIKSLPVQAGDTVMVYYAGHGTNIGTDNPAYARAELRAIAPPEFPNGPPTAFPFLACGTQISNSPNLDMIATWLATKKPRLTIVMADACNSYLPNTGPPAESFYAAAAPAIVQEERLRSLFREASGTVLMTGSQPGHYSYYFTDPHAKTGGVFTLMFLHVIDTLPINASANWQQIGNGLQDTDDMPWAKVERGPHETDTQLPLLRVGAPFETAVPLETAMIDPTRSDNRKEVAQVFPDRP